MGSKGTPRSPLTGAAVRGEPVPVCPGGHSPRALPCGCRGWLREKDDLAAVLLHPETSCLTPPLGLSFLLQRESKLGIRDLHYSLGLENDRIFWIRLFYGNSGQGMMRLIEWNKWGQETNPLNQGPSVYIHPLCPSVHGAAGSLSPTGARPSGLQFPAPELPAYMTLGWNLLPALFPSLSFVQWK